MHTDAMKELHWIGTSLDDLRGFPVEANDIVKGKARYKLIA